MQPSAFGSWIRHLTPTLLFTLASSCASSPPQAKEPIAPATQAMEEIEREILEADTDLMLSDAHRSGQDSQAKPHKIPLEINESVRKWIHYFTVKDRDRFHRFLKRGSRFQVLVKEILKEHGVPTELYYLAMIESGYSLHATSHASAVGAWQFIRGTGLRYGLKQDYYIDERRDIIRSTHAGAQYLKSLHQVFNSWYLAMAGYNAGEGRILGAIMRGKTRDFWELVEKKALPPETRDYVPKFLAAAIIGKHPEKYGFHDIDSDPFPSVTSVEVPGGVPLEAIAERASVSMDEMRLLNAHLIRDKTPANRRTYPVWVPSNQARKVSSAREELAALRVVERPSRRPAASRQLARYKVKRGESLELVAKKHGMTVAELRKVNGLQSGRVAPGATLRVVAAKAPGRRPSKIVHRVRRGEGLAAISARYSVPVESIKRANELRSSRIYVGQQLVVPRRF